MNTRVKRSFFCLAALALVTLSSCKLTEEMRLPQETEENDFRVSVIERINNVRAAGTICGGQFLPAVSRLAINARIDSAAKKHADDMRSNRFVGRVNPAQSARLGNESITFCKNSDLIAFQLKSKPSTLVELWRSTTEDCKKIMDANYDHIGFGKSEDYFTLYLVEEECSY